MGLAWLARSVWESLSGFLIHLGQTAHQATLAAGSVVLVDDAFFGGLIQGADSSEGSSAGIFRLTAFNAGASLLDERAGATGEHAVAQAALVILFDAFDCRFGISQLRPPKKLPSLSRQAILLEACEFVQFSLT